jgi:hypothetical protein
LNLRMLSTVKHSNALPSPPPFGNKASSESTDGRREGPPIAEMKCEAKGDPR